MKKSDLWTTTHHMNPMMPRIDEGLEDLAMRLVAAASELRKMLHPISRMAVRAVVEKMNCYYSNLIEGHHTSPLDIERALAKEYASDPAQRALQLEAEAHVEVQRLIEEKVKATSVDVLSSAFLQWIHAEFYRRLPEDFLVVKDPDGKASHRVMPGELRTVEVHVGRHVAPKAAALPGMLEYFSQQYRPDGLSPIQRVVALAASHHRLLWIHPFLDGNGRVVRLMTNALLIKAGLDANGLWTPARGLARQQKQYYQYLAAADEKRRNDYDGRGNLSEQGLGEFCKFFLETCIDQARYMSRQLEIASLDKRIDSYIALMAAEKKVRPEASRVLREVLVRGEVHRGEAERISGLKERTARDMLSQLLKEKLITSDSPKGKIRITFPVSACYYYFPQLFQGPGQDGGNE